MDLCALQGIKVLEEEHPDCIHKEDIARSSEVNPKVLEASEEIFKEELTEQEKTQVQQLKIAGVDNQGGSFLPRKDRFTLSSCLRGHENFEAAQDDLIRLLCHLRMGPNGCDAAVVPKPLLTRKLVLSRPMKWHNLVRHQIAQEDLQNSLPAQRRSRVSAWVEASEKARQEAAPTLPSSILVGCGDIVATRWRGEWHCGLVLTTYRILKKGAGAQPVTGEVPKGSLHSARILILRPEEEREGYFIGDINRPCLVVPVERISLRLDGETSRRKASIDGVKVLLGQDSWGLKSKHPAK